MIIIKPINQVSKKVYAGNTLMEVMFNGKYITKEGDIVLLKIDENNILKLSVTKNGIIKLGISGNKEIRVDENSTKKSHAEFYLESIYLNK